MPPGGERNSYENSCAGSNTPRSLVQKHPSIQDMFHGLSAEQKVHGIVIDWPTRAFKVPCIGLRIAEVGFCIGRIDADVLYTRPEQHAVGLGAAADICDRTESMWQLCRQV